MRPSLAVVLMAVVLSGTGMRTAPPVHHHGTADALPPIADDIGRLVDDFFRGVTGKGPRLLPPVVIQVVEMPGTQLLMGLYASRLGIAADDLRILVRTAANETGLSTDAVLSQVDQLSGWWYSIRPPVAAVGERLRPWLKERTAAFSKGMVCGIADEFLENQGSLSTGDLEEVLYEQLWAIGEQALFGAVVEFWDAVENLRDIAVDEAPGLVTSNRLRLWVRCLDLPG